MMPAQIFKEDVIITAFLFLVLDRTVAILLIRFKVIKIFSRPSNSIERRELQFKVLSYLVRDYWVIQAMVLLFTFTLLGLMQIVHREFISDDTGRLIFAAFSFVLSVAGTAMNVCIETLEK